MASHPLATKIEKALEHAKRLRDELLSRKTTEPGESLDGDPPGTWRDSLGRLRYVTRIFGFGDLGGLASNTPTVAVDPGEALGSFDKKKAAMRADKRLAALNEKLARELEKCARQRDALRGPGGTKLTDDGRLVAIRRKNVSLPCPGAVAAQKALEIYIRQRYGDIGPARSGGGGGGGW